MRPALTVTVNKQSTCIIDKSMGQFHYKILEFNREDAWHCIKKGEQVQLIYRCDTCKLLNWQSIICCLLEIIYETVTIANHKPK